MLVARRPKNNYCSYPIVVGGGGSNPSRVGLDKAIAIPRARPLVGTFHAGG